MPGGGARGWLRGTVPDVAGVPAREGVGGTRLAAGHQVGGGAPGGSDGRGNAGLAGVLYQMGHQVDCGAPGGGAWQAAGLGGRPLGGENLTGGNRSTARRQAGALGGGAPSQLRSAGAGGHGIIRQERWAGGTRLNARRRGTGGTLGGDHQVGALGGGDQVECGAPGRGRQGTRLTAGYGLGAQDTPMGCTGRSSFKLL